MKKLIEINNGVETVLASGNLVKAWEKNKRKWIGWLTDQEKEKFDNLIAREVKTEKELEEVLEELDYSWYNLEIKEEEEKENEMKELLNQEMTLLELNNKLIDLGYNDFFEEGINKEILKNKSVSVTRDNKKWENLEIEVIKNNKRELNTTVKVTGWEEL